MLVGEGPPVGVVVVVKDGDGTEDVGDTAVCVVLLSPLVGFAVEVKSFVKVISGRTSVNGGRFDDSDGGGAAEVIGIQSIVVK